MKYKLLLILFVIAILLSVGFFIYNVFSQQNSAVRILNELLQKKSQFKKYSLNYSIVGNAIIGEYPLSYSMNVKGSVDIISINGTSKTTAKFNFRSLNSSVEYYSIPEGKFIKTSISTSGSFYKILPVGSYEYEEIGNENITGIENIVRGEIEESRDLATLQDQLDSLMNWTKKGIAHVSVEGESKIIGRDCYNFKFYIDTDKLAKELNISSHDYLLFLKDMDFTVLQCVDKESGLPLSSQLKITSKPGLGRYDLNIKMEAIALSFDVKLNKIELPVPKDKVIWLPKFRILETKCQLNSNKVEVTIKANKNIYGKALLKVISTSPEKIYPNKNISSYDHYCFNLSDITSGTFLKFTLKNINKKVSNPLVVISVDCPEFMGKKVGYPSFGNCGNCSKGKYCFIGEGETTIAGDYLLVDYTFYSDLPGTHEICIWENNETNYLWKVESVEIYRKMMSSIDIGNVSKGEIKTLNFTLPSNLSEDYYIVDLTINDSTSSSFC